MDIKSYLMDFYISQNGEVITPELAKMFVEEMPVTDGSERTNGEKWTMEEAVEVGKNMNIDFNKIPICEWYLVLNMMYSDYFVVGRKHNLTDWQLYAELAHAWFYDVDAKQNKTFKYFFN